MSDPYPKRQDLAEQSAALGQARRLRNRFEKMHGRAARVFCAPGRVNLIGEHTDYNEGFVMPVAMDLCTWVAAAPREDSWLRVYSINLAAQGEIDLRNREVQARRHWTSYIRGVAASLLSAGVEVCGADLLVDGKIPMGAGLGSSAALEVATGYALLSASGLSLDRVALARICQRAENDYAGARCGIMDQLIACCGRAGSALMLDCRSLHYLALPLFPHAQFVVCNSMVKHNNAAGEYNARRADCEAATQILARHVPDVRSLRDVSAADLERLSAFLPGLLHKRCRHVIGENARVSEAGRALAQCDPETFGHVMGESHRSLREDYEVSCAELDLLVELACRSKGVYGARMTGGGFGGCTISLVHRDHVEEFARSVATGYQRAAGHKPEIYTFTASDGVREVRG